jgi:hypothetical protein
MNKNTLVLLGILLVLVVVAVLVMQKPGERSVTAAAGERLFEIDSLAVDKIEVTSPTSSVVLEKKGVEWFLQQPLSYRADQNNVAQLIQQVKEMQMRSTVSSNPEKQNLFQVDSTGTQVRVYERGAEKAAFVLGKSGSAFNEVYLRKVNSNDVVLAGGAMSYVFNRAVKEWRDKTIAQVPKDNIKEVTYQYGDTLFTLAFKDSAWVIGKDSTQQWVVDNILSSLSNFQADDFIDTPPATIPKVTAVVTYAGVQLSFHYQKEGEKYLVRASTSPQWFEVSSWRANQVLKRKKEIVKDGK